MDLDLDLDKGICHLGDISNGFNIQYKFNIAKYDIVFYRSLNKLGAFYYDCYCHNTNDSVPAKTRQHWKQHITFVAVTARQTHIHTQTDVERHNCTFNSHSLPPPSDLLPSASHSTS